MKKELIIGGVVIFIIIILFSYYSLKIQEVEDNKINSVKIIDIVPMHTMEQESRTCSLCRNGIFWEKDGTKTCSEENCLWKDTGNGAMAIANDCRICMTSKAQDMCKLSSLKLTFQTYTPLKDPQTLNCKIYNNYEVQPEGDSLGYSSDPGLNVLNYVFVDYSKGSQRYMVCCVSSNSPNEPPVCSGEYPYSNPC